jgi:cation transport regulator ChaC
MAVSGVGVWYFAYGRNVNVSRFCERIRGYPLLTCRGILPGYRLVFNKKPGPEPGLGYSNIVPTAGEYVEGILYLITERMLSSLDRCEVVPEHYVRSRVTVWDVDHRRWVDAVAYVAVETDDSLKPPKGYLEEIVEAAKTMGLSCEWVSKLEKLKGGEDAC